MILRQNMAINYEAPYVPAVRGARAVLMDPVPPSDLPLRTVIDSLVTEWLAGHARNNYLHCQSWPERGRDHFYGAYTGLMLTADIVYPGRVYVEDWPAFRATIDRLIASAKTHPVSHVFGCHVEMTTTPGVDHQSGHVYAPTSRR